MSDRLQHVSTPARGILPPSLALTSAGEGVRRGAWPIQRGGRVGPSSVAGLVEAGRFRVRRPRLAPLPARSAPESTRHNLEHIFQIIINAQRSRPTCRAHGVGGGNPLPPSRAPRIAPIQRGGRAGRVAAKYQPGYDGLPGGAQGLRALASMTIRIMITIGLCWVRQSSRQSLKRLLQKSNLRLELYEFINFRKNYY